MRTRATVLSVEKHIAIVECDRVSACEECHKRAEGENCAVCSLMSAGSSKQTARAYDPIGVLPGDVVALESGDGRILFYAVLVFVVPLLFAVLGYFAGSALFAEAYAGYIGAGMLMILAFLGLRFYSERVIKRRLDVTVAEILERKQVDDTDGRA